MKTILVMIMTLVTLFSSASFAGYSNEQLRLERKCSVNDCKANDGGYSYKVACESKIFHGQAFDFGTEVLFMRMSDGKKCYCPGNAHIARRAAGRVDRKA